jgi:hypothetical protein
MQKKHAILVLNVEFPDRRCPKVLWPNKPHTDLLPLRPKTQRISSVCEICVRTDQHTAKTALPYRLVHQELVEIWLIFSYFIFLLINQFIQRFLIFFLDSSVNFGFFVAFFSNFLQVFCRHTNFGEIKTVIP